MQNDLTITTTDKAKENLDALVKLFPGIVTEAEDGILAIDKDALEREINTRVLDTGIQRYKFTWPDKNLAERKANEPIKAALRPCREESVDFDTTENLYIEGDNLCALKLLRESYKGAVKMIYIDPPYNTGNDFIYKDDYSESGYSFKLRDGQIDYEGNRLVANSSDDGRFHTNWLNMMYPRLKVAWDLLSDDGVIFVQIDDNEIENLKKVCNEIFGEDNYINTISLKFKNIAGASGGGEDKRLKKNMEFILVYTKNYNSFISFENFYNYTPLNILIENYKNDDKSWKYTSVLMNPGNKVFIGSTVDGNGDEIKIFKREV